MAGVKATHENPNYDPHNGRIEFTESDIIATRDPRFFRPKQNNLRNIGSQKLSDVSAVNI